MEDTAANEGEYAVPILRHQPREPGFELATGDEEGIRRLLEHVTAHFGEPESVFHEIVSDLVHIDVHFIPPTPRRPYHTLVTTGMSDRRMNPPSGAEQYGYAELMVMLPQNWPLGEEAFRREENYWPVRWLKQLARLPHEYNTWLFHDHTVPNGDPARPFAADTQLCCWWLWEPRGAAKDAISVEVAPGKTIYFLQLIPLYREEMEVKLRRRSDGLLHALAGANLSEEQMYVIDKKRPNAGAAKRGFWPFRR